MDPETKAGFDRAKKHLDVLAEALDRVTTDPEIRRRMETHPIETLKELGFELDEEDRDEILQDLIEARTTQAKFPSVKSLVKSGVKSTTKTAVVTGVTTGVKTVITKEK
jgi:hypothetical protein